MAPPQPLITPPPLLPRQTTDDPYGLNSIMSELSSLYPELYSSYSYDPNMYSSLLGELFSSYSYNSNMYSSLMADYYSYLSLLASDSDYVYSPTLPIASATAASVPRLSSGVGSAGPKVTSVGSSSGSEESGGSGSGLSNAAKIGIGIGVPLTVAIFVGVGIFLWCAGKRKGKKTSTTIVAPPTVQQQQQHPNPPQSQPVVNNQGYIPGFQPTPPPQHATPAQGEQYTGYYGGAGTGYKEPMPGVMELEHEYHFARPGVVEIGESEPAQEWKKSNKNKKSKK